MLPAIPTLPLYPISKIEINDMNRSLSTSQVFLLRLRAFLGWGFPPSDRQAIAKSLLQACLVGILGIFTVSIVAVYILKIPLHYILPMNIALLIISLASFSLGITQLAGSIKTRNSPQLVKNVNCMNVFIDLNFQIFTCLCDADDQCKWYRIPISWREKLSLHQSYTVTLTTTDWIIEIEPNINTT